MSSLKNSLVLFVPLVRGTNGTNSTNEHRYKFEKDSRKHLCPNCNKKRFVRYIDIQTGDYLPHQYGRCDRESKCSYFLNPYKDGYAKEIREQERGNKTDWKPQQPKRIKKPVTKTQMAFIPYEIFSQTRGGYEQNVFIQNLLTKVDFPCEVFDIEKVISLYHLGTIQHGYCKGANTFPFIDSKGNVRAIQVKKFDEQNHTTGTDFIHSIIGKHHKRNNKPLPQWLEAYNKNEKKVSCLFGEHLLKKFPNNPIALVEAPKTAIYNTLYFGFPTQPKNLLWLAVYNLSSLNLEKCKALKGRNVYLFPDLSKDGKAFELWSTKATEIQSQLKDTFFHVSNLLEQLAPQQDKEQGKDLADYLIKQDWRLFRKQEKKETPQPKPEPVDTSTLEKSEAHKKPFDSQPKPIEKKQPNNWSNDIAKLETYFENIVLPTQPIQLNKWSIIKDSSRFIDYHFKTVKANNGNNIFLPYLVRLQQLNKRLIVLNSNNQ